MATKTNALICYIDPFAATQYLMLPNKTEYPCTMENLAQFIPATCYSCNIQKVHLFGNETFINGLIEDLQEVEKMTYGHNDLEIEVN